MKKRRIYVLSIDAMISEDIPFMRTLPNLGPVLEDASIVSDVITVYPSLTYTVHASMLTGVYPNRHHVVNNEQFVPGQENGEWFFDSRIFDSDVENVVSLAKNHGYTTCCISWPVTGHIDCDYLLNETWTPEGTPDSMYEAFLNGGSTKELLDLVWPRYGRHLNGLSSPYFHLLAHGAALEAIRKWQPEVIFHHLSMVDHMRHGDGVYGNKVYSQAYLVQDLMFGAIVDELKQQGLYDDTTFIITSDHGQTPVDHLCSPNVLLVRDDLIRLNEDGTIRDFDAVFHSAAHSCFVYLRDPDDRMLRAKVYSLLLKYQAEESVGFSEILTAEEVDARYRNKGSFSFMIEGTDGYSFTSKTTGDLVCSKTDDSNYKYANATHGHMPEKGPKPAFIMKGPGVKKNVQLSGCNIVDEAPTIAKLLGFEMKQADGQPIYGLLEE
ncbi:alkaline phosphatase family protein [Ruthenibacterium lactatiformans]|uniref:alkaline phosphatase family protein n=1 Tax=Ruthenibacterium lactatiformans TaxID=1550024 RepID=UPI0019677688|nr:alkaline phosphatase family protein [Ruthenibacterium lactatiformans]MBN3010041.1 alkaline phosphatase family protein [Ruthenibacterium lactatiformans]